MTAGQGGPYGEPTGPSGQPQGWNAPPSPPPYGQQYPGYGPAPSAPTGYGAPAPLERPVTVRAGIGAFVGGIVLSIVAQVITALKADTIAAAAAAQFNDLPEADREAAARFTASMSDALGILGLIVGLVFTGVFALFVWFAWRGHQWSRIVLWVLAGLGLVGSLIGFALPSPLPILTALSVFEMMFDAAGILLLALKPSNEWFRFRGWQRATGQG
jgi:hypothetical protein